jgi:hypothetical protein
MSGEENYSKKTGIAPEWRQPVFSLVHLVYPVSLVQPNKQDKPDRQTFC